MAKEPTTAAVQRLLNAPAEREECRALWRDVGAGFERVSAAEK